MFNGYCDFALRVPFCKVAESFGGAAQWVASIDDGAKLSGFEKILQENQIFLVNSRDEETNLVAADA